MRIGQAAHLHGQSPVSLQPGFLDLADLHIEFLQRLAHRLHQLVNGKLPPVEIAARAFLKFFQRSLGKAEECGVVALERFRRECLEGIGKSHLRLLENLQLFGRGFPLLLHACLQGPRLESPRLQFGLRHCRPRGFLAQPRFEIGHLVIAGGEPLLQRGRLRSQDEPCGNHREKGADEEAGEKTFHDT